MDKIIPDLDLIRATAILMVVGYHVVQWLPAKPKWLLLLTNPGQYGVNLFFALSGFLVGSLYFRERMKYGNVDKSRFILKLITRTVPIYLIALAISFLGSRIFEGEAFEWTYLIFLQNYLEKIPYFKVSWSLCVEEHFYAILPFFLTIIYFLTKHSGKLVVKAIIISTLLLPTLLRISEFKQGITHAVVLQALNMAARKTPKFIQDLWPLIAIIFIGSALLAGIVFYKLIESPLLKIREKYYPSRGLLASG